MEYKTNIKHIAIFATVGVFLLWGLSWWIIDCVYDDTARGTFGDMFGAVNALFSGLAFAGLIITLITQQEELKLQRKELELTRTELKGQKKEFEEQNKTLKRQRFENTFFNMLSIHQEIVTGLYKTYKDIKSKTTIENRGREVFVQYYNNIYVGIDDRKYTGIKQLIISEGIDAYNNAEDINMLDHYFRYLYRILKYTHETDLIDENEKYNYTSIVRAQLSDYELIMLFYNGLSDYGCEKLKPLIEEYAILKNTRFDLLANPEDKDMYNSKAYNHEDKP